MVAIWGHMEPGGRQGVPGRRVRGYPQGGPGGAGGARNNPMGPSEGGPERARWAKPEGPGDP